VGVAKNSKKHRKFSIEHDNSIFLKIYISLSPYIHKNRMRILPDFLFRWDVSCTEESRI